MRSMMILLLCKSHLKDWAMLERAGRQMTFYHRAFWVIQIHLERIINMKKAYRAALCGVVLSGVMAFNAFGFTPINSVAAIVNDGVITQTQLNQKMVMMKAQMKRAKFKIPSDSALKQQVLQQMIDQLLQIQAAKKMGIQISNTELNAQLSDIAQNNKISVDDLYQSVQKDGWTIESFREETREELMMKELEQREVVARISISPQEVDNFLNIALGSSGALREYHLQRIVLALPDAPSPDQVNQVKNDADVIFKQLKSGTDFLKTAISNAWFNRSRLRHRGIKSPKLKMIRLFF